MVPILQLTELVAELDLLLISLDQRRHQHQRHQQYQGHQQHQRLGTAHQRLGTAVRRIRPLRSGLLQKQQKARKSPSWSACRWICGRASPASPTPNPSPDSHRPIGAIQHQNVCLSAHARARVCVCVCVCVCMRVCCVCVCVVMRCYVCLVLCECGCVVCYVRSINSRFLLELKVAFESGPDTAYKRGDCFCGKMCKLHHQPSVPEQALSCEHALARQLSVWNNIEELILNSN